MIVFDPDKKLTIEAGGDRVGHDDYTQWASHHIFEVWRVGATR